MSANALPTVLTPAEIRALGTVTTIETAGRAFGLSRSAAYDLAARGKFPCPVVKVSERRYRVPVAGLLRALGLDPENAPGRTGE